MTNTYIPAKPNQPPAAPNIMQKPVQPKRKVPLQYIIGGLILALVLLGGIVGFYLLNQNQDVRQQASVEDGYTCPPNSKTLTGGKCICDFGDKTEFLVTSGKTCDPIVVQTCALNTSPVGNRCLCDSGIEIDKGQTCPADTGAADGQCGTSSKNISEGCQSDNGYTAGNCPNRYRCGTQPVCKTASNPNLFYDSKSGQCQTDPAAIKKAKEDAIRTAYEQALAKIRASTTATQAQKLEQEILLGTRVQTTIQDSADEFQAETGIGGFGSEIIAVITQNNTAAKTQAVALGSTGSTSGTGAGGYPNVCNGMICPSTGIQCVAVHRCAALDSNGHCTIDTPEIRTGSVDAQQVANTSCQAVQIDVLSGLNGSCINGHINTNAAGEPLWSNLLGSATATPNNGCGLAATPTATPVTENNPDESNPPVTTLTCGATCGASGTQCPNGHTCNTGTCKLNACLVAGANCNTNKCTVLGSSPTPSPTVAPIVCGSDCTTTSQCPQDHTCNAGKCQLTACVNGEPCSTDKCRATACSGACTANTECPNNHVCSTTTNKCVLTACVNGNSCSTDSCRVTACGSACSANSDCPNDHSCSSGVCKLNACLVAGANCTSNQCATITTAVVVGCNNTCVNNSDCQAANHICVDTANGRRCRLETNITSDTCSNPGTTTTTVTQTQTTTTPGETLPIAGSADVLKAMAVGATAVFFGIVGFLLL